MQAVLSCQDLLPVRETAREAQQTDDPAIWVNRKKPAESLVLGTVKVAAPDGAVSAYRLDGSLLMRVTGVDRPNNIDVAYGVRLGGRRAVDIAVVTERNRQRLRVFEIIAGIGLRDLATIPVFEGEKGSAALPMGVAMYRDRQGRTYAIVSRKSGPSGRYLWQYRLDPDTQGRGLHGVKVREFGAFSGSKEIEAVAVDQELDFVYYSDEGAGIRKYQADPAAPNSPQELALFATGDWGGDREGIAVYNGGQGRGFVVVTEQLRGNSRFHIYPRQGDQTQELGVFQAGADTTDGIEICSEPLGPEFPKGLFVAMNDRRHNFVFVDMREIVKTFPLVLKPRKR